MSDISRIEIFCDDRLVQTIKRLLIPMKGIHDIKDQPVINAQAKNGKVHAVTNGSVMEMFIGYARKRKLTEITAAGVAEFMATIGKAPTAAGYLIKLGQEAGMFVKNKEKSGKKIFTYDIRLPKKG